MIPNSQDRNVQSEGVTSEGTFGISAEDTAHIMGILRDTMYSDKVLAVLREYAANAWDANREAGTPDKPIKIHVPTMGEPTLTIRDNGPGLSDKDVFTIYTQYGASTKRGSDVAVGMLGIGSKSAFAYSDTFTITSWHGGKKRIYVAVLDDSDLGKMQRLHEEDCDESETGVEIKVAIRPEDIWEFHQKARNLYSHFIPRPEINIDLRAEREATATLKSGTVYEDGGEWVALMGCIPYRINIEQLRGSDEAEGMWMSLTHMSGILNFDIGEVEINASREELKYTKKTKMMILDRFMKLTEEYVENSLKLLKDEDVLPWAKRLRLHGLGKLGLPFPESAKDWVSENAKLYKGLEEGTRVPFVVLRGNTATGSVRITSSTRLVVKDDKRKTAGFRLGQYDYVVKPNPGMALDKVRKFLAKLIKKAKIDGIEVVDISTLPYWPLSGHTKGSVNKKHQVRSFRLIGTATWGSRSKNWEIETREPTDNDVFVIISRFEAVNFPDFYRAYEQDVKLAKVLKLEMPEVYGYKTTEKKPITENDCKGTNYREWREEFFKNSLTPTLARYISYNEWATLRINRWSDGYHNPFKAKSRWARAKLIEEHLEKLLGKGHPIVNLFARHVRGVQMMEKAPRQILDVMDILRNRFGGPKHPTAGPALKAIEEKYPLLTRYADLSVLYEPDSRYADDLTWNTANEWAEYIKLKDAAREKAEAEEKDKAGRITPALARVV